MDTLNSKEDFEWYKKALDVNGRYEHKHVGEPENYPCKVRSNFWDDPNGPYTYEHEFLYEVEIVCPSCGHTTKKLPDDID